MGHLLLSTPSFKRELNLKLGKAYGVQYHLEYFFYLLFAIKYTK